MDNDKYIGRLLDNRYEIQEVIGIGGMAVVYKARCHRLNRLVAIKILKDEYFRDEEFRRRFHAESQAVAMLSHPNIVSVYDVSKANDADYIVMELIDGISLKQYMEKKGVLNWKETLHFAIQIGKALEHAHGRGIVHRDIKPHNVMVLKNGSVKVADFGIAQVMSKSNTLTKEALGSVHYISPEQAKGGRVDSRSDLYSLGVVMYEMMTGRPPYDGESPVSVAIQHINGGAPMPSTLNPNIPGGLEQIIMKAMAHDPAGRYVSAAEMLYDMDEFRKNPAILFEYNLPPIDAVPNMESIPVSVTPPRAVSAERTTGRTPVSGTRPELSVRKNPPRTGTRTSSGRTSSSSSGASRPRTSERRRREAARAEEDRSKVATIAIVVCSVVAIVAITIFLVTLLGGGVGGDGDQILMPTLIGKYYENLQPSDDYIVRYPEWTYNDTYEKGQIIEQKPDPGEWVDRPVDVYLVVSHGPEPKVKMMEDMANAVQAEAENYLRGQGFVPLAKPESSDTVPVGQVIRTEPDAGDVLEDGQTVIIWVSAGPEIVTIDMLDLENQTPEKAKEILDKQNLNLVYIEQEETSETVAEGRIVRTEPAKGEDLKTGDTVKLFISTGPVKAKMPNVEGEELSTALKLLNYAGFENIKYDEYADSDEPLDTVLTQSVEADQEVPVSTQIVLTLSLGPTEPTTVPTLPEVTKSLLFGGIDGATDPYTFVLKVDGVEVYRREVQPEEDVFEVQLTGSGVVVYEIFMNDVSYGPYEVNFTA